MSWESITSMPGSGTASDPFRAQSEPVLARREGLTPRERASLFWRSTPELPSSRAARHLVMTPSHLYVERVDGSRQRVGLGALRGRRDVGGLLVYGIADGEDLALLPRAACPIIQALEAKRLGELSQGESATPRINYMRDQYLAIGLAIPCALGAIYLLATYSLDSMWDRIHHGLYTAEVVLGVVGGFASALLGLALLQCVPVRVQIDALGVLRTRGLVPWLQYLDPPETFTRVERKRVRFKNQTGASYNVLLRRREPGQRAPLLLRGFYASQPGLSARSREEASVFAGQVGRLLRLEVHNQD